jgi:hypothetical protein
MGSKAPDVLRNPPTPEEALTCAEIYVAGWELRGQCSRCGLGLRGSAHTLTKTLGPSFVLWGYTTSCPRWDPCDGRFAYSARSVGGGTWKTLRTPAPERVIAQWKARRGAFHKPPR